MYPVSIRLDDEHIDSLKLALATLKTERTICERWGHVTTRLALTIDDLEEIIDRAQQASKISDKQAAPLLSLVGRHRPW